MKGIIKKISILMTLAFTCLAIINIAGLKVHAENEIESSYDELCEELESAAMLDDETIAYYEDYIVINKGKYQYNGTDYGNEDVEYILQNIEIINQFVADGEGYISSDEGLVFYCEEELDTQFGFTSVKWHWYGVDLKMNNEMINAICFASLVTNLISGAALSQAITKGASAAGGLAQQVMTYVVGKLGSYTKTANLMGSRFLSKIIDKFGSYDNFMTFINATISTVIFAGLGVLSVAAVATCGVAAVVWTIVSYIIGVFTPGIITSTVALILSTCNVINTATMKIRWLCGWGTNLYY